MLDFISSICDKCDSECCKTSRSDDNKRTPYFELDERLSRAIPIYKGGSCIYIKDSRCTCYDRRPFICRAYPLYVLTINGETKIGINTKCDAGKEVFKRYLEGDEQLLKEMHELKVYADQFIDFRELEVETDKIMKNFKYVIISNV